MATTVFAFPKYSETERAKGGIQRARPMSKNAVTMSDEQSRGGGAGASGAGASGSHTRYALRGHGNEAQNAESFSQRSDGPSVPEKVYCTRGGATGSHHPKPRKDAAYRRQW